SGGLLLTSTQFISNTAGAGGGGALVEGQATLLAGLFETNSANGNGGGINADGALALTGTQFIANTASAGSALYHAADNARIVNALFARNSSQVIQLASPGSVQILHTTIASPTLSSGTAIYGLTG